MVENLLTQIIGGKINNISRVCDLICIEISNNNKNIFIHIQSFFRILKNNKVIISGEDIYRCKKDINPDNFNWDIPGDSIFDEAVKNYYSILTNSQIIEAEKNITGDLYILLENNLFLQIIVDTSESEEKYRVFDDFQSFIMKN